MSNARPKDCQGFCGAGPDEVKLYLRSMHACAALGWSGQWNTLDGIASFTVARLLLEWYALSQGSIRLASLATQYEPGGTAKNRNDSEGHSCTDSTSYTSYAIGQAGASSVGRWACCSITLSDKSAEFFLRLTGCAPVTQSLDRPAAELFDESAIRHWILWSTEEKKGVQTSAFIGAVAESKSDHKILLRVGRKFRIGIIGIPSAGSGLISVFCPK